MKNVFVKAAALVVLCAGFLTSCGDDDDNGPRSTFVVDPENFQGIIGDGEVVLQSNVVYQLEGPLVVGGGATLTIPAGTVIEATGGTAAYIAVSQGGKIFVNGTASNPVIMTSGAATPAPGDWGGLVICGRAPINIVSGGTGTAQSEVAGLQYGGNVSNDNSGSVRYLRIEFAGAPFSATREFNGASLFGVGSGTVFEYVQTFRGSDDGFEFFGGTVNTSNLVSIGNEDDQFDWTEGWSGTNTNWYGRVAFGRGNRGIEADNYEFGFNNTPVSNPTINNLTLVGAGSAAPSETYSENHAIKLRRGTRATISNVALAGFSRGIDIEHDETIAGIATQALRLTNVSFTDITTTSVGRATVVPPATSGVSVDVTAAFTTSATATGAGNGIGVPTWSAGWTTGLN